MFNLIAFSTVLRIFTLSDTGNDDFDYYFGKDGQVRKLNNFKKQILPLMNDHPEVLSFIRDNRVNLDNWEDQYRVFNFYNNLKATEKNPLTAQRDLTL